MSPTTAIMNEIQSMLGIFLLFIFAISPVACTMHQDYLISELIKSGVEPVEARCAIANEGTKTRNECSKFKE